jgi:hypothetical protein
MARWLNLSLPVGGMDTAHLHDTIQSDEEKNLLDCCNVLVAIGWLFYSVTYYPRASTLMETV